MPRIKTYHLPGQEYRYDLAALEKIEGYIIQTSIRYTLSGYSSEDIRQELRMHFWKNIDKYNPKKSDISTWATKVIHQKMVDLIRIVNGDSRWQNPKRDVLNCWESLIPLDDNGDFDLQLEVL